MTTDRNTIGLTASGRKIMDKVMEKNCFKDQMDAAKFAVSLVINSDIKIDIKKASLEGIRTSWNIGSFDPEGELKNLIIAIYPHITTTPYRFIEYLIDRGLIIIGKHLDNNNDLILSDLMSPNTTN